MRRRHQTRVRRGWYSESLTPCDCSKRSLRVLHLLMSCVLLLVVAATGRVCFCLFSSTTCVCVCTYSQNILSTLRVGFSAFCHKQNINFSSRWMCKMRRPGPHCPNDHVHFFFFLELLWMALKKKPHKPHLRLRMGVRWFNAEVSMSI